MRAAISRSRLKPAPFCSFLCLAFRIKLFRKSSNNLVLKLKKEAGSVSGEGLPGYFDLKKEHNEDEKSRED